MKRILPALLAALLLAACDGTAAPPAPSAPLSSSPASKPAPAPSSSASLAPPEPETPAEPALPEDWEALSADQTADLFTVLGAEDSRTGWRLADDVAWIKAYGFAYPVTTFSKGEGGWQIATASALGSGLQQAVVDTVLWDGEDTYCLVFSQTGGGPAVTVYEEAARPWCRLTLAAGGEQLTMSYYCPGLVCRPQEGDELTMAASPLPPEQAAEAARQADESGRVALEGGGYLLTPQAGEAQRYLFGRQQDFLSQAQALDGEAAS